MSQREGRQVDFPATWRERLDRRACPVCGTERKDFDGRHRGSPCCSPACTEEFWGSQKTWQQHRSQIFRERHGICAGCGFPIDEYPKWDRDPREPGAKFIPGRDWVLDHIRPIALGGSMWDPANHQILCEVCNKIKTAKDLGDIAAWKRIQAIPLPDFTTILNQYADYRPESQVTLF